MSVRPYSPRAVRLAAALVLNTPAIAAAQALTPPAAVPLRDLLAHADAHAPALRAASLRREYAEAERAGAAPPFRENPTLALAAGPRFEGDGSDLDYLVALLQPVEIAGQRGLRLDAAEWHGRRLEAEHAAVRAQVRRDVIGAYRAAAIARERLAVAGRIAAFAEDMLAAARRRLAAGDASAIDVRVAEIDRGLALQARLSAEQELRAARIDLATVTGWDLAAPPDVATDLAPPREVPALDAVLGLAREHNPALRVRRAALAEASTRRDLADREAWPTPSLGVELEREGSVDGLASDVLLATLSVPLPLWRRNQELRSRARVDEDLARVDAEAAVRLLEAGVSRAHGAFVTAAGRLALFTSSVEPALEDGLALLQRGFEAGEIGLLELAVVRERLVAARRDALGARADYENALADLELAVGTELPSTGGQP